LFDFVSLGYIVSPDVVVLPPQHAALQSPNPLRLLLEVKEVKMLDTREVITG
jgi:hypothetical protein